MRIKLNNKCEQQSEGPKSEKQNHYQMQGQECDRDKGKIVNEWSTGDDECNAYSVNMNVEAFIITIMEMQLEIETMIVFGIAVIVNTKIIDCKIVEK